MPREFGRLLRGFHPHTDEPLVQNAGKETRQLGWDVQFAVDKSVSVLYAMVPEARGELETCLREAVRSTVIEVAEAEFLQTRRGKGGHVREPVSSPVAGFLHRTNRENEIHLHYHATIPNVGLREDGTTGSLVSWNLYDAKLAFGKAFHARFAEQVTARLGIECEFDEHGLSRVKGFPEPVAAALSTPARKIAEVAEDDSAKAKEEANLKVRSPKGEVPFEVVVENCHKKAAEKGFSEDDARAFLGRMSRVEQGAADEVARAFVRGVVENLPREFSKAQLFEKAIREGARAGLPFSAVNEAIRETLADGLEPMGRVGGKELFGKAHELQPSTAGPEPDGASEEEFREFLGRIIETTPELRVAEFLPPPEKLPHAVEQEKDSVLSPLEAALAEDDRAKATPKTGAGAERREVSEAIGTASSGRNPADFPPGVEPRRPPSATPSEAEQMLARSLDEAISSVTPRAGAVAENPLARAALKEALRAELEATGARERHPAQSISIDTTSAGPVSRARDEAERAERRWVDEAKNLREEEARSLLREAVSTARAKYAHALVETAITRALSDLTRHEAHFTGEELTRRVEAALPPRAISRPVREAAVARALLDPERTVPLGKLRGVEHYTTPEMLRVEREGLSAAAALRGRDHHAESRATIEGRLGRGSELTSDERDAVVKALAGSDLVVIEAKDGLQMQAVQRGLREALREGLVQRGVERALGRKDVLWVAPTATAAVELKKSVGAEHVASLQKLLHNLDRGFGGSVMHHGRMVVHAALGLPTWDARQLELTSATTVVLDSASLADTRQFSRLLQHAAAAKARVIACGTHEMPSLGPGGFYKELRDASGPDRVVTLSGRADNRVEFIPLESRGEAKEALIEVWAKEASKSPKEHTIVAVSSDDVCELNAMAQAKRKEAGLLGFRSLEVRYTHDGETVKERIYEGDRVVFTARTAGEVINGVFGTVKRIDLLTGRVKVVLDLKEKRYLPWEFERQKTIDFQYRNYRFFRRQEEGFRLGYAATVYRSQSVAVEGNSYCLVGGPDGAPSAVYAGLGLAKGTTYFFTDGGESRADLLKEKRTAHAVMRAAERQGPEPASEVRSPSPSPRRQESGMDFKMGF